MDRMERTPLCDVVPTAIVLELRRSPMERGRGETPPAKSFAVSESHDSPPGRRSGTDGSG